MNWRKSLALSGLSLSLLTVITSFQNCAPAGRDLASSEVDGEVRLIDDWNAQKVAFAERDLTFHAQANLTSISGVCRSDAGADMNWRLVDKVSSLIVEAGASTCHNGIFRVEADVSALDCRKEYVLLAEDAAGDQGLMFLKRECAPLASSAVLEEGERRCEMELVAGEAGRASCQYTCYVDDKLHSRLQVEIGLCPSLTAAAGN